VKWNASLSSQKNCQRRRQNSLPLRHREFAKTIAPALRNGIRIAVVEAIRKTSLQKYLPAGNRDCPPPGDRFARSFAGMTLQ
jgi:hypothetical protein